MNLELAASFFWQPIQSFKELKNHKTVFWATIILIITRVALLVHSLPMQTSIIAAIVRNSIGGILLFLLVTLYVYGTARLFNGNASYAQTYQAMAFSYLPMVLFGPIGLLQMLWPSIGIITELSYLANILLSFWMIYLQVLAVRETHQISTGSAIISLIAVPILLFILLLLIILVFGLSVFTLL